MSQTLDPFTVPMVFFRVGWMHRYRGLGGDDSITRGGGFVEKNKFGHEILNFQPVDGWVYGYVQPRSRDKQWSRGKVNTQRLGAETKETESLEGVLVVWVATSPAGGGYIVGWYKDATVYRHWQEPPPGSDRTYQGEVIGYFVKARQKDAVLLPDDRRVFAIQQKQKGSFGQSNVWYADDRELHGELRTAVLEYVRTRHTPPRKPMASPRQPDVLLRQKVEQIAIETTARYYRELGYLVKSVESDNVGWDLEAILDKRKLLLEVKGLSGQAVNVQLTPNEYANMQRRRDSYRLCTVTQALASPNLEIFQLNTETGHWESDQSSLRIDEIMSARCTAERRKGK